jgi:tetratricopeptide (TPR) repeat protein
MLKWRIKPYTAPNDLPPIRRTRWAVVVVVTVAVLVWWMVLQPEFVLGPPTDDPPLQVLRIVVAFTVAVVAATLLVYATWRFQLERLAYRPGPILVQPFDDLSGAGTEGSRESGRASPLAIQLTSYFQQYVVRSRLYGTTAIPPTGRSTDFLRVIEGAGDSIAGVWGALSRLPRLISPTSTYQVACTILPASGDAESTGSVSLLVELTRLPKSLVAPTIIRADSWERAVEQAAHWVAGVILPRTRRCRQAPWTMWRTLRLPDDLFDLYQRFQFHKERLELDEAMAVLRAALRLDPSNLALRLERGKLQEQLGMQLDALATYDDIIGRASRGDRSLAILWNLPPTDWGSESDTPWADDQAWSDSRRISEIPANDPVVYVARYRHMLLLGLGEQLTKQWWQEPSAPEPATTADNHCAAHPLAHERRSTYSRNLLAQRLKARYPWVAEELKSRNLLVNELNDILTTDVDRPGDADPERESRAADLRIFLTATSLCELELLLQERGRDLLTHRAIKNVVSLRSLRLVLPWGILRAGLAIKSADRPNTHPQQAERSIVFRLTRPHIMPSIGAGLLDTDPGWPPNLDILARYVSRTLRSPLRTLHTWHEHYNAACAYALTLLQPRPTLAMLPGPPKSTDPASPATTRDAAIPTNTPPPAGAEPWQDKASAAAVSQLYKAVACGDSGFLASQREWLLAEDPDLDILRGTSVFFDLEASTFGSVRATQRRGPQIVTWRIRTFTSRFVLNIARQMNEFWRSRPELPDINSQEFDAWLTLEKAAWEIVADLCREHLDSTARSDAVQKLRSWCRPHLRVLDLAHPRFSERDLSHQYASLRDPDHDDENAPIERQVQTVIARTTARFAYTLAVLRPGPYECCSKKRPLVSATEIAQLRMQIDAEPEEQPGPGVRSANLQKWIRTHRRRWEALAAFFDDQAEHSHCPSASARLKELQKAFTGSISST